MTIQLQSKALVSLALPLVIGQVAQTGIGVVDTMIAGSYSKQDLAGVALGTAVWLPVFLFFSGVLLALTPLIAQAIGRQDQSAIRHGLMQGIWLSLFLSAMAISLIIFISNQLYWLHVEHSVEQTARYYLWTLAAGVLPALLYQTIRFFHEGHGFTAITMRLSIFGFLANIPLNYIFVYGWGPIPEMGGAGCGIATSLVYLLMMFGAWWFYFKQPGYQAYRDHWQWFGPQRQSQHQLLKVGTPIAAAILFEVGLFTFIAFLITPLGTDVLAAHQIAISYTSFIFMLPLSLAMALTIRVGQLHGAQELHQLHQTLKSAYLLAIAIGLTVTLLTFFFADWVVNAYTQDPSVKNIAITLLWLAALYQLSDAVQVISAGALRGIQDTAAVMWITFIAYWAIGLPTGYWLCYGGLSTDQPWWGVNGFWFSFVVGLTVAALGLTWRVKHQFFRR